MAAKVAWSSEVSKTMGGNVSAIIDEFRFQLSSLFVGPGFEILTLTSKIQVFGDQHAFRGRMAMFAVLVVTMRHHLFTADDEGLID